MKTLIRENTNRVYLDDDNCGVSGYTVTLTVMNESGEYALDANGDALSGKSATYDADNTEKYYVDLTFAMTETSSYIRLFWKVLSNGYQVPIDSAYAPEDCQLSANVPTVGELPEIIPVQLFIDEYLAQLAKLDSDYVRAIAEYAGGNRQAFRNEIQAAQALLENETKVRLFATTETMDCDYYQQNFNTEFWLQTVPYRPLISVDDYKLVYGGSPVNITQNIAQFMALNKAMGTIEFMPTATAGTLFVAMTSSLNAIGATLASMSMGWNRVPLLFRIEYTCGIDYPNLPTHKKAGIRQAVAREALISLLPRIDPQARVLSESSSIDGVSHSQNAGVHDIIKELRSQQARWAKAFMMEYGTHMDITVV